MVSAALLTRLLIGCLFDFSLKCDHLYLAKSLWDRYRNQRLFMLPYIHTSVFGRTITPHSNRN